MKEFSYEDIKSSTKNFSVDTLIGKGSHGHVYKATLKGSNKQVAIKKPYDSDTSKLKTEIQILSSIRKHPNLVNTVGVSHNLLVLEYMPNGSLYNLLHSPSSFPLCISARLVISLQIASAISSLHNGKDCKIIHRDIKSENILFDGRWNARLSDFSLAVRADDSNPRPLPAGTLGYIDPGYTDAEKVSTNVDVYSFGVLLLEIMSSRKAIDMDYDPASIVTWSVPLIKGGGTLDVCDQRVVFGVGDEMERAIGRVLRMAGRCVCVDEERRPSMQEVVRELGEAVKRVFVDGWVVRIWKRCMKMRVGVRTRKIVCRDRLGDGDRDEIVEHDDELL